MLELIKSYLIYFNPKYWITSKHYDKELDCWLKNAIKHYNFEYVDEYFVKIDGKYLWIANYPYSVFYYGGLVEREIGKLKLQYATYKTEFSKSGIPSRRTIYIAAKKLKKDCGIKL